jgi:hypothetical protein
MPTNVAAFCQKMAVTLLFGDGWETLQGLPKFHLELEKFFDSDFA